MTPTTLPPAAVSAPEPTVSALGRPQCVLLADGSCELTVRLRIDRGLAIPLREAGERQHDELHERIHRLVEASAEYSAWRRARARLDEVQGQRRQLQEEADSAEALLRQLAEPESAPPDAAALAEIAQAQRDALHQADTLGRLLPLLTDEVARRARALHSAALVIANERRSAALAEVALAEGSLGAVAEAAAELVDRLLPGTLLAGFLRAPLFGPSTAEQVTVALIGGPIPPPPLPPRAPAAPVLPQVGVLPSDPMTRDPFIFNPAPPAPRAPAPVATATAPATSVLTPLASEPAVALEAEREVTDHGE
jgi:hypothetical protein